MQMTYVSMLQHQPETQTARSLDATVLRKKPPATIGRRASDSPACNLECNFIATSQVEPMLELQQHQYSTFCDSRI